MIVRMIVIMVMARRGFGRGGGSDNGRIALVIVQIDHVHARSGLR